MKKFGKFKTDKKNTGTVMAKPCNTQKDRRWLNRLALVAESARTRVSSYSDERRSHLEQLSRSMIQGAKATQVCSR